MESGTHDGGIVIVPSLLRVPPKLPQIPGETIANSSGSSADPHTLADRFDNPGYVNLVKPGVAIVGVAKGPHSYFGGVKSSVEFMA
jgi:hypothetical protein